MTDRELLDECIDSENLGVDGFRVVVEGLFKTRRVRIAKGLSSDNLGHYPLEFGEPTHTHLWVKNSDVRKYLSRIRE